MISSQNALSLLNKWNQESSKLRCTIVCEPLEFKLGHHRDFKTAPVALNQKNGAGCDYAAGRITMRGFAIFTLVLAAIGSFIGLVMMITGNRVDGMVGSAMLGGGFTGILLSCVVIALADIQVLLSALFQHLKVIRNEMSWKRDRERGITDVHCVTCATKVTIDETGEKWCCPTCNPYKWFPLSEEDHKLVDENPRFIARRAEASRQQAEREAWEAEKNDRIAKANQALADATAAKAAEAASKPWVRRHIGALVSSFVIVVLLVVGGVLLVPYLAEYRIQQEKKEQAKQSAAAERKKADDARAIERKCLGGGRWVVLDENSGVGFCKK